MLNPRHWFIAAIALWLLALLTAIVGLVFGVDGLYAFSWPIRRVAAAVSVIWLLFALVAAVWRRLWRRT